MASEDIGKVIWHFAQSVPWISTRSVARCHAQWWQSTGTTTGARRVGGSGVGQMLGSTFFFLKSGQEEILILYDGSELGQGDGSSELRREKDGSELGQRDGGSEPGRKDEVSELGQGNGDSELG